MNPVEFKKSPSLGLLSSSPAFRPFFQLLTGAILLSVSAAQAQTQAQMNNQAAREFAKADTELNQLYTQVLAVLDDTAKTKLKAAQRAWVAFRDAEAELEADQEGRGGTIYPLSLSSAKHDLTDARIKQLRAILKEANGH